MYGRNLAEATMSLEEDLQSLQIPPAFADYQRRLIVYSYAKTMEEESAALHQALQQFGALERSMNFPVGGKKVEVFYLADETHSVSEVIDELRRRFGNKLEFEPDGRMGLAALNVNDPFAPQQWALENIEAQAAWDRVALQPAPQQVTVAIVDSGIMRLHEDLDAALIQEFSIIPTAAGALPDDTGHGTMLAGVIGAISNNARGVAGEGRNVRIIALKITDERTPPTALAAGLGVLAAHLMGASVINCAWHVLATTPLLGVMISFVTQQGLRLVVIAAGNYGSDNTSIPTLPASWALPGTIAVMASDRNDYKCWFSNYGATVDLAAPGQRILSTGIYYLNLNARYPEFSGTSPASAHVSAAAALLLSMGQWTPAEIRTHLNESADRLSVLWGTCISEGRLNLRRAVCGPFQILAPVGVLSIPRASSFNVRWTSEYPSTIMTQAEISVIDDGTNIALGPAILVPATSLVQSVPIPNAPGTSAFIRVRGVRASGVPTNLYTDSDVFQIT
jgi:thermitase